LTDVSESPIRNCDPIDRTVDRVEYGRVQFGAFGGAEVSSAALRSVGSQATRESSLLAERRWVLGIAVSAVLTVGCLAVAPSAPAFARAPTIKKPGAPTVVQAVGVDTAVGVTWEAPSTDGGSPITGYTATVNSGQKCTTTGATTCTVTGLTNGKKYSVKVQAFNAVGTGRPSRRLKATPSLSANCSYFGPYANLESCNLSGADLSTIDLTGADLSDVSSGGIIGTPSALPSEWGLIDGYLIGPGANLTGADLTGADLAGSDLNLAFLINAVLTGTDLTGVDLSHANLTGVISGGITQPPSALPPGWSLTDGYLIGPGANLAGVNFSDVDLTGVAFNGVILTGATFTGANLTGVSSGGIVGTPSALPSGWSLIDGYLIGPGANLAGAQLFYANLNGVDFDGANLSNANLRYTSLTGSNLNNADLAGADPSFASSGGIIGAPSALPSEWFVISGYLIGPNASLVGANLAGCDLNNTNMEYANLSGANLSNTTLSNAVFDYADLTDANFTGATLPGAILFDATITGLNVTDAGLAHTDLFGVLSGGVVGTPDSLPQEWGLVSGYFVGPSSNLTNANLTDANLTGNNLTNANLTDANLTDANLTDANLTGADLSGVIWSDTICPDGANSDSSGGSCINDLG